MTKPPTLARPAIPAILHQHLEEAAFYWLRRQAGLWSPAFRAEHVRRFDLILDAHLEGLRVGGAEGVPPALESLAKWKTPDEAFVATYLLLHAPGQPEALGELEAILVAEPECAPGAAAALLWSTPEAVSPLVEAWSSREEGPLNRAALPAVLRQSQAPGSLASRAAQNPFTRARALRALGELRCQDGALVRGLGDEDPEVRTEAILALWLQGDPRGMDELPHLFPQLRPTVQKRALLVWAGQSGDQDFEAWMLQDEAPRLRLWAAAFRGDGAWIPYLAHRLEDPKLAPLAACSLEHITGMSLDLNSLDASPAEHDASTSDDAVEAEDPEDTGLLAPDPGKIREWLKSRRFSGGQRFLGGHAQSEIGAFIEQGTQPQRWQAAYALARQGQADALKALRQPALKPHSPRTIELRPPSELDWVSKMMRGREAEQRGTQAQPKM